MGLGGRELAVLGISEGLRRRGHDVVLALRPGSLLLKAAQARNIPCATVTMAKSCYFLGVQALRSLIRRHRIELIHTHSSRDRWLATTAAYLSVPRPMVVIGRHHCGPIRDSALNRLLYGRLCQCVVTTGGERLKEELVKENGLLADRVAAIPTGVELTRFHPGVSGMKVRRELEIPPEAYVVGTVCFLRNYKGLQYFVAAAAAVLQKAPDTRFIIVGDGPERDMVSGLIRRADLTKRVLMLGHREDVPAVMAAMDVYAVCSTGTETLTQTIPQAFAMEKPVVATNVGGIPDIVIPDVTGLLIPPGDPDKLAEAIFWCMNRKETAEQLARAGREHTLRRYSAETALDRTEQLYTNLIAQRDAS